MYFKDFPQFLYDFNYGNGVTKTTVVRDITRNVRFRKEVLENISMFDEYDVIDGETPEVISEKFYGTPEYHWVVMLANQKYDWSTDWPLREDILQKHIKTVFNPVLSSTDWYWNTQNSIRYLNIKITSDQVPFDAAYLTAPVTISIRDDDRSFETIINFPNDPIGLNEDTQYFYFPFTGVTSEWLINHGKPGATALTGVGNVELIIETTGREHNPVKFINVNGVVVDPKDDQFAIPVTGDEIHRAENNQKRRIRLVSPTVLETVIKNYEELLR